MSHTPHELAEEFPKEAEKISALKERVQTLEKIVIDNHKSSSLSDEIEKLRDNR